MEKVSSESGAIDKSDENVDMLKSDELDEKKEGVEETEEKVIDSEGLELSIAEVSSVSLSSSVGENKGDDVNKSIGENAPKVLIEAKQQEPERVKCPFCDFEFEEFSSDAFTEHLRTVHLITKNLDILLEFSLKTLKKGNKCRPVLLCQSIKSACIKNGLSSLFFSAEDVSGRLECVSPESLPAAEPQSLPENLSDIESDDEVGPGDEDAAQTPAAEVDAEKPNGESEVEENKDVPSITSVEDDVISKKKSPEPTETTKASDTADSETLTLNATKDVEYFEAEAKGINQDVDALSDLSLSEEDFDKNGSDWVVLDDADKKKEEIPHLQQQHQQRRKVPPESGDRPLSRSSQQSSRTQKRPAGRIRTLPPELYNAPDLETRGRGYGGRRSRSPPPRRRIAPPREERRRVAPPAPSPPGYEDRREKVPRFEADFHDYQSRRSYDDHVDQYSNRATSFPPAQSSAMVSPPMSVYQSQFSSMVPGPGYSTGTAAPLQSGYNAVLQGYSAAYQAQVTDHLPSNYTESLHSLQPLQTYMSSKMAAMPGQPYPRNYIDLLISNVGKMLAQANLGLR